MRNNSSRAGLHRYKRNLLFPFFALIFALPNLIGCTQVLPIEEGKQEINGSVKDWWKIQCKLPPKTKRFCPLKTFNNAPLKSLDRWGYYYFRFSTV